MARSAVLRMLWLIGLAVIIAHVLMMTLGGLSYIIDGSDGPARIGGLPLIVRLAMWLESHGAGYHILLTSLANALILVAYLRRHRGRSFMAMVTAWVAFRIPAALLMLAAKAVLVIHSPITPPGSRSTYLFGSSEILIQSIMEIYLSLPMLIFLSAWIPLLRPSYRRRLFRNHKGQCLACGYDLQGSVSDRCPECGEPRLES